MTCSDRARQVYLALLEELVIEEYGEEEGQSLIVNFDEKIQKIFREAPSDTIAWLDHTVTYLEWTDPSKTSLLETKEGERLKISLAINMNSDKEEVEEFMQSIVDCIKKIAKALPLQTFRELHHYIVGLRADVLADS